jgi:hypothetical protein
MEQRYQAVSLVIHDGESVVEVARRFGVSRQTVHAWLARYERGGLAALADRSHRPKGCAHQSSFLFFLLPLSSLSFLSCPLALPGGSDFLGLAGFVLATSLSVVDGALVCAAEGVGEGVVLAGDRLGEGSLGLALGST